MRAPLPSRWKAAAERMSAAARRRRWTRWATLALSAALLASIAMAALLYGRGWPEAMVFYAVLERFCHQDPARSWSLFGAALPVCVRCLGVYAGALLAALAAARFSKPLFAGALALCLITWVGEVGNLLASPAEVRFAVGLMLGYTAVAALTGCTIAGTPKPAPRPSLTERNVDGQFEL